MSTAPLPSPVFISTGRRFDPEKAQPAPSTRPRCRALTVGGHRCKNKVLGGLHLCFSHYRNRRPALPDQPKNVSVPLLEDRSAIQLMTTQILHGILSHRLDPERARVALYAIRIAALTLPRPRQQPEPQPAEADETVAALGRDHEDFISADGDLSATELNPSCSVADSPEALAELINTLEPRNRCHPEDATPDVCPPDPSHNFETCACYTCADYRDWIQETTAALRSSSS